MLNSRQKKCIELMVDGKLTQREIAKELNVAPQTICTWKHNAEFISARDVALRESIKDTAAKAFATEIKLLNARSEMVRLLAAKDVLDRAGFKADDNLNLNVAPVVIVDDCNQ